jgi:hypothetical protein
VAHCHGHPDQVQGDAQFAGQTWVSHVVGTSPAEVEQFFGLLDYPNDIPCLDRGQRVLDLIGTPGREAARVAL